jgi:hypothetical protein
MVRKGGVTPQQRGSVAHELVERAVPLVRSSLGGDEHLRARPLAAFRSVRIAQNIEFADRPNAQ